MWQVLFKGFQELQNGFHLFQLGEMIIIRLIYISSNPNPEGTKKEILNKKNEDAQLISKDQE